MRLTEEEIIEEIRNIISPIQIMNMLKRQGYVRLAKNQSLPKLQPPKIFSGEGLAEMEHANGYSHAQQDMLNAGFKKVEAER